MYDSAGNLSPMYPGGYPGSPGTLSAGELAEQQRRNQIIDYLYNAAINAQPIGRLDIPDSRYLDEDFLGGLKPGQDLLLSILGMTSSPSGETSRANALAQQQAQFDAAEDAARGEAIAALIGAGVDIYTNRDKTAGSATGPSAVDVYEGWVDPSAWAGYPTGG
jgi:hypothetical protein